MAQQLSQLIPDFLLMTYEEKLQVIERIRYHKYISKPSYTKKKTKQTLSKKKTQKKKEDKKVKDLMKQLSPEQIAALLKELN